MREAGCVTVRRKEVRAPHTFSLRVLDTLCTLSYGEFKMIERNVVVGLRDYTVTLGAGHLSLPSRESET